jgi:hypothetical protein
MYFYTPKMDVFWHSMATVDASNAAKADARAASRIATRRRRNEHQPQEINNHNSRLKHYWSLYQTGVKKGSQTHLEELQVLSCQQFADVPCTC